MRRGHDADNARSLRHPFVAPTVQRYTPPHGRLRWKFGPARSIDDGGWAGEPEQFGFGPQCLGYAGYHLTDFLRHLFADLCIVGAHRAFEVDLLRQHIPRIAALNAGDADHHRLLSAEVAADQGLQGGDDVAGGDNAVDTVFRVCGVRAFAGDGYLEAVNVGIERPPFGGEGADRQLRRIVQAKNGIDIVERSGLNQLQCAVKTLFGRLEE